MTQNKQMPSINNLGENKQDNSQLLYLALTAQTFNVSAPSKIKFNEVREQGLFKFEVGKIDKDIKLTNAKKPHSNEPNSFLISLEDISKIVEHLKSNPKIEFPALAVFKNSFQTLSGTNVKILNINTGSDEGFKEFIKEKLKEALQNSGIKKPILKVEGTFVQLKLNEKQYEALFSKNVASLAK